MDLKSLDFSSEASAGAVMALEDPITGKGLLDDDNNPVTITLRGLDSTEARAAQRDASNKRLMKRQKRGQQLSVEDIEETAMRVLVACTVDWSGIVYEEETLICSPANVQRIYQDLPWVAEQVDDFTSDRRNFLGNS